MVIRTPINEGWEFRLARDPTPYPQLVSPKNVWRPATVPGQVHLDLVANGLIQDPFVGQAEAGCQWVDLENWEYRTIFEWSPGGFPKQVLRFDGLDTCCTICLNGEDIAHHDNMFLPLEVDVSGRLLEGANELSLRFRSAVETGEERRATYFQQENLPVDTENFTERAFVRKAQYM